jgi:hypothetical protein
MLQVIDIVAYMPEVRAYFAAGRARLIDLYTRDAYPRSGRANPSRSGVPR